MNAVAQLNSALAGRYAVDREIGAGGMATVYLARDIKHDRNVALKVLLPELGAILTDASRFRTAEDTRPSGLLASAAQKAVGYFPAQPVLRLV